MGKCTLHGRFANRPYVSCLIEMAYSIIASIFLGVCTTARLLAWHLLPARMKITKICFWTAALLLLAFLSGVQAGTGPLVLTEQDTGRTVSLKVGERLILDLRNPASGGYSEIAPDYDHAVLQLISRKPVPPEAATQPRLGDFGRIILIWQARSPGETALLVRISRPWEKGKSPLVYVKLKVRVSP
jgi:predicted secreted protein